MKLTYKNDSKTVCACDLNSTFNIVASRNCERLKLLRK